MRGLPEPHSFGYSEEASFSPGCPEIDLPEGRSLASNLDPCAFPGSSCGGLWISGALTNP